MIINRFILLVFLISSSIHSHAQYWMRSCGGPTLDEGLAVATGPSDETVTTGYFTNTATFGTIQLSSGGVNDVFVLKTDAAGVIQWVKQGGGGNVDKGLAVCIDLNGNVVVTGFFNGTAQFDAVSVVAAGQQDIFIAKYNSAGALIWVQSAGGVNADLGNDIRTDQAGNIIVTGEFSGTCSFGPVSLSSMAGSIDVFIAKYDPGGNLLWVKQGSGNQTDRGTDLALDNAGNIYVNGLFSDTILFDVPHYTIISNAMFLIKYNPLGQEQWFRWMGATGQSTTGGMAVMNNTISLTGSFTGNLNFYGNGPAQTLSGPGNQHIYLCRYDDSGNLLWKTSNGSVNDFTAEDITVSINDEITVTGNFKCRLTDFSAAYGDGIFCSIGFSDTYTAGYNGSGQWQWARQAGGVAQDYVQAIAVSSSGQVTTTGSYEIKLFSTYQNPNFTGYNAILMPITGTYCGDPQYNNLLFLQSFSNSADLFINSNTDLTRQPLDFFERTGVTCLRPFGDVSICLLNGSCPDSLTVCGKADVEANPHTYDSFPLFNYLWSNGLTTDIALINTTGITGLTVTSTDGCFSNTDSIFVTVNPIPPVPLISDSKGYNFFNQVTVPVHICIPDSVMLFSPNSGFNQVQWTGFASGVNPATVTSPGVYMCTFTDSNGCTSFNNVQVIGGFPFAPVYPEMICLEDSDYNDTIEVCEGTNFNMYTYDTLSNPNAQQQCITALSYINWNNTVNGSNYTYQTNCGSPNGILTTPATTPGTYTYFFSAWVVRINVCDTDSVYLTKPLYVIVNPSPPGGNLTITITGPGEICFGDTAYLVASGGTNYLWANGNTNDSLQITTSGFYTVSSITTVTNGFGCSASSSGFANHTVNPVLQPVISTNPPGGKICPNDSLQLICSGMSGTFQWQGPNGILPGNTNTAYVSTPGLYYCIQTLSPNCQLVSNTMQVSQATTPNYAVLPSSTFCTGDSVEIFIYVDSGSFIMWDPPLFGYEFRQVIFTGGNYGCDVYSCNQLYHFAITITEDSGLAIITSSDTSMIFCQGDSIQLSANAGMSSYTWLPSGDTFPDFSVTNGGSFQLITSNVNGCRDTASILITEQLNNLRPPQAQDTMVCAGDSIILVASNPHTIHWTASPDYSLSIGLGPVFQTPSLFTATTYYLFSDSGKCKSLFDSVTVFQAPPALAQISASDSSLNFCEGDSIQLTANPGMDQYLWLPGLEQQISIYVDTTLFVTLITTNEFGCRDTALVILTGQINNLTPPTATDTVICTGESILLSASGSLPVSWASSPDFGSVIQTGSTFQTPLLFNPATYYLFADSGSCNSAFDSVTVFLKSCSELPDTLAVLIPNIITPDGDGLNDVFPGFKKATILKLTIINRWGTEIFSSQGQEGWKGKNKSGMEVPDGTYFYILDYSFHKKVRSARGMVVLIR